MKILGIDFGLVHFGLAINHGSLVEPLGQLKVTKLEQAINKLTLLCKQNQVEKIVIGLPEGKLKNTVIGFSRQLKQKTGLPIFFQEEDFTSKNAVKKMVEAGKPLKKRKQDEHVVAACLILQEYLDTMT